jgi:hypothetical protein
MVRDQELQHYYEESFDCFASRGWTFFIEDMENLVKAIDDLGSVDDIQNLYFRKGQLDILKLILNRKNDFENAWSELNQ